MELEDNYYVTIEDFEGYNWKKEDGVILLADAWLKDTKMKNCNSIYMSLIMKCISEKKGYTTQNINGVDWLVLNGHIVCIIRKISELYRAIHISKESFKTIDALLKVANSKLN